METSKVFILAVAGLMMAAFNCHAKAPPPAATVAQQADQYLQTQAEAGFFAGTVLIARKGEVLFAKGYGQADAQANLPNTVQTRFRIASITKVFTASMVLKLEEQGRLNVSDPVCKFITPCPDAWKAVTVHHLLAHTSGIPNYTVDTRFVVDEAFTRATQTPRTPAELIALVRDKPLQFTPGEKYSYTNSGYVVLGVILEKAGGKPYAELLDALILTPLGMRDTGVDRAATPPPGQAKGYAPDGTGNAEAAFMDMTWLYGVGDIYSTVEDLLKWDRALDSHKILSEATLTRMWTPDRGEYGYGWQLMPARHGFSRPVTFHAGGMHGFASDYLRYADDGVTVIILSNLDSSPMLAISRDLSAITFGEPYQLPVVRRPVTVAPEILAAYAGDYQVAPGVVLAVRAEDGRLTVQVTGQVRDIAIPESDTKFFSRLTDTQVTFVRNGTGQVTGLVIHQGGRDIPAGRLAGA